jgi:hypothetical protein
MVAGLDAIDRRTLGGRELAAWWDREIAHLGGNDEVTHPEATLIKRAGVLEALIRNVEAEFLVVGLKVGKGKAARPHPLLADYRGLVREQREILTLLGLKRRAVKLSLGDVLAAPTETGRAATQSGAANGTLPARQARPDSRA